jgi:hypothetical protein
LGGSDEGEDLGRSVVKVGDIDGDGWDEVAVGAPGAEAGAMYERGCVRLVSGRTGTPMWRVDGRGAFDLLGVCVESIPDWDGDGAEDVLAGARAVAEYHRTHRTGRVVVLSGRTGESLWQADIEREDRAYISSVCACDDLDGDGRDDIVVGASSGYEGGCVQVLGTRTGTTAWRAIGTVKDGWFGSKVKRVRDFDGDGVRDLLVTAPKEGDGGVLHVLSGVDGSELRVLSGKPGEHLGTQLFAVPDLDGDGISEVGVRFDGEDAWQVRVLRGADLSRIGDYPILQWR